MSKPTGSFYGFSFHEAMRDIMEGNINDFPLPMKCQKKTES